LSRVSRCFSDNHLRMLFGSGVDSWITGGIAMFGIDLGQVASKSVVSGTCNLNLYYSVP
jgi:hypothetical protein